MGGSKAAFGIELRDKAKRPKSAHQCLLLVARVGLFEADLQGGVGLGGECTV